MSTPELTSYKNMLVVQRQHSVDVIDPSTGKWYPARSLQAAKWNISVWQRLCREFQSPSAISMAA